MNASSIIQDAVARVADLRVQTATRPDVQAAASQIKALQARRFGGTYADLLADDVYRGAVRFFLEELYSEKDYSRRDAQFARIAGPLDKFFPQRVVDTAVAMARLHALTEELDHAMALAWVASSSMQDDAARYVAAWRTVGRALDRDVQLATVLHVGCELERLVRLPGLRMSLRLMRRPAHAAGLGALQAFLEAGFDTFAGLVRGRDRGARQFLATIEGREAHWMAQLFQLDADECAARFRHCLASAA